MIEYKEFEENNFLLRISKKQKHRKKNKVYVRESIVRKLVYTVGSKYLPYFISKKNKVYVRESIVPKLVHKVGSKYPPHFI